jgi:hypothetical protein
MRELLREMGAAKVKNANAAAILKRAVERLLEVDWDSLPMTASCTTLATCHRSIVLRFSIGRGHRCSGF